MNDNSTRGMTVMDWQSTRVQTGSSAARPDASALCTPEERAFLDALKAGKSLVTAQHAANIAWARRNLPELDAMRAIMAERNVLWERWSAAWGQLELPFKGEGRWNGAQDAVYDYCSGEIDADGLDKGPRE